MKVFSNKIFLNNSNQKGLTLVEVAIVLVILGLLIGLGASLIGPLTKRAKLQETRDIVKAAKEAFLGFAIKNGYLPQEGNYNTNTPVEAFQIVGTKGLDAWGMPLRYIVADELKGSSVNICEINSTTLNINDRGTPLSNIAFLIISAGGNYNIQTENTIYEVDTPNVDDFSSDIYRPEEYDDIVTYVSLEEIRALRGCPPPLTITITSQESPDTLNDGEEDSYYSYYLQTSGGSPPYTWSRWSGYGLTLNPSGLISGIINYNTSSATGELTNSCSTLPQITITTSVTDTAGSPPLNYTGRITIKPKQLKIITEVLPTAYEGTLYSATISASGGKTPYLWSMSVSPSCPTGLTCLGNSISGIPAKGTAGTYEVTITANPSETGLCTATKKLSLTINPAGSSGGGVVCISYRVWNQTGRTQDFTVSGVCRSNIGDGIEITTSTITLNSGGSISRHESILGNCTTPVVQTLTYSQAQAVDTNRNCEVNFTLTGFTDR